jgi:hypothetical protein
VQLRNKAAFGGGKDFSCVPMSFLLHFETTVGLLYIVVCQDVVCQDVVWQDEVLQDVV